MRVCAGVVGLAVVAAGCSSFEDVEEACKDGLPGDSYGSDEADAFFQRLDCYRRFAGVERPRIDQAISESVVSHTSYLSQNGIGAPDWASESSSFPGYTGDTVFDRLESAGYPLDVASTLVWQVAMPADPSQPRANMVDLLIHDPHYRDPLFAPGWLGGGYAEGTDLYEGFAYSIWTLALPSASHSSKPVLWPVKDAEDVPISWLGGGYPITMTFGSSLIGGNPDNPLDVLLHSATITSEDGTILEHVAELPGYNPYFGSNNSTIMLFPLQPLQPDTLYTVEANVSWISYPEGNKTIDWSFVTGSEEVTATLFQ